MSKKNKKKVKNKTIPKAIYQHLKPRKWYNDLFDKIVGKQGVLRFVF
jgi:hypothetical protein